MNNLKLVYNLRKLLCFNLQNQLTKKLYQHEKIIPFYMKYSTQIIPDDHRRMKQSERENSDKFILKNDPDVFGASTIEENLDDEGDVEEDIFLENPPLRSQKLRTKQYADMIKEHLRNKEIPEAIQVLEQRMIKEDRVKPENYIFNLLIGGCARAGYSKKAFQLYNRMKQRDLKVTGGTYTSLFNACATSPWLNDGLNKANQLREIMIQKGYIPNESNYNAMIKAYGRCGDIQTAFQLVDEMLSKQYNIQLDTCNFLLQACASDKELGFRHALIVWHKIYQRKLTPDLYSFNLLLRCTRDCGIGDTEVIEKVIEQIISMSSKSSLLEERHNLRLSSSSEPQILTTSSDDIVQFDQNNDSIDNTPNLISAKPRLGSLVAISEITKPEDRLLLIGGLSGFLDEMNKLKITPNVKTFTELLEVIPPTLTAEKKIISTLRKMGVKADIDFFNILIKKRSMRFDYESAKEVLFMIKTAKLEPDIVTYGVLALGCQTFEQASELIEKMRDQGIRMNIQILGAMLKQGCYQKNFQYIYDVIEIAKQQNIKSNEKFLIHLDTFFKNCRKLINQNHPSANKEFRINVKKFRQYFDQYLEHIGCKGLSLDDAIQKLKGKPYDQFKAVQPQGYEKTKGEKLRHKSKTMRYIRKINADKLKGDGDEDFEIVENLESK